MAHEELDLLTHFCDFTNESKWLESSIESDLCMRFAIWSLDLAFCDSAFFKHSF